MEIGIVAPLRIRIAAVKIDANHVPIPRAGIVKRVGIVYIRVHPDVPFWRVIIIGDIWIMIDEHDFIRQMRVMGLIIIFLRKTEADDHERIIQDHQRTGFDHHYIVAPVIDLRSIPMSKIEIPSDFVLTFRQKRGELGIAREAERGLGGDG